MQTELHESIKNCRTLPAIPVLAVQILSMCQDVKADSKKMAELISHDPAFAAKLLSLANSGFYARIQHQVTNLSQAVTLLGREAVAVLAFSFSLYRNLRKGESEGFDHQQFWRRSILASISGRVIAKWAKHDDYEEVFLGALLQDIGMLALSVIATSSYHKLVKDAALCHHRLKELELEHFGNDHAEVGAWLAEQWKLPTIFHDAIRGSHNPGCVEKSNESSPIVSYVALSGPVADIWCGAETEKAAHEAILATGTLLNKGGEALEPILTEIAEGIPMISTLFEIDLGSPEAIQHTLQVAKEALLNTSGSECSS